MPSKQIPVIGYREFVKLYTEGVIDRVITSSNTAQSIGLPLHFRYILAPIFTDPANEDLARSDIARYARRYEKRELSEAEVQEEYLEEKRSYSLSKEDFLYERYAMPFKGDTPSSEFPYVCVKDPKEGQPSHYYVRWEPDEYERKAVLLPNSSGPVLGAPEAAPV